MRSVARIETFDQEAKALATGSGFFIGDQGELVTNYHVIDGASSALIRLGNGAIYEVAGFLAADEENDIAILQVSGYGFEPLSLGALEGLRVGEEVVAIGSPLGREGTVSSGIVSALRSGENCEGLASRCIQTTAPISPGSSGGPLLNLNAEVIGVTSALVPGGQGLNFAVAVDLVASLATEIGPPRSLAELHSPGFLSVEPTLWTSSRDGAEWRVRRIEGTIFAERVAPKNLRERGFAAVCEYSYSAEDRIWNGVCRIKAPTRCGSSEKVCSFKIDDSLLSLSPEKLTRLALVAERINCASCTITSSRWEEISLLPQGPLADGLRRAADSEPGTVPQLEPLQASIKGKVVSRSEDRWTFSWAILLTSRRAALMTADATIQFLDEEGLVLATDEEIGIQVPANRPITFRGLSELEAEIAGRVKSLGVKVQARPQ